MIYPAKYNGINFSYGFTRESQRFNFDGSRLKHLIPKVNFKYLSFFATEVVDEELVSLTIISELGETEINPTHTIAGANTGEWYFYFEVLSTQIITRTTVFFKMWVSGCDPIYSELCQILNTVTIENNEIAHLIASNDDDRHGFLSREAFGFFKFSIFKSDIFVNKAVTYEQSYSRKKVLSSENQIAKRFTFYDLTMYQQNLLKWLCNCENLSINGVNYQLISDFSELENDENTEIKSLRADFVESEPSFFANPSTVVPKNVFPNSFFTI